MNYERVYHTFGPVFDESARVLILGSIPSPKSREISFYYGNPQNRFWRVLAAVLDEPFPETVDDKRAMVLRHHIALWDVLESCDIQGAGDTTIRNPKANNLKWLIDQTKIRTVFATGAKAAALYEKLCQKQTGLPIHRLPSTSPANAAWSLARLTESYRVIGERLREQDP
jgi:hypoxanthine-DNA glycosylase